jgi:hypothetical protein
MSDTNPSPSGSRTLIPVRVAANIDGGGNVVFFGNTLSVECQRCGAFTATTAGHKYCVHVTCPIALREFTRRKRKRTSTLEKVYVPRIEAKRATLEIGGPRDGETLEEADAELAATGTVALAAGGPAASATATDAD